jgi:hypothetical protein
VAPDDWPEGRQNELTNGGFEDIDWMEGTDLDSVYQALYYSDNWGAWFVDGVPEPPGWLYEVPSGFSLADEGGLWCAGYHGSPIPTPGMNDVVIHASDDLILGQIIGGLSSGQMYYLDMACAVKSGEYGDTATWPGTAPQLHLELWQIPVSATDGDTIHTGITTSAAGYNKIKDITVSATGNLYGGGSAPKTRWQLIGDTYTATSADTNVYLRLYGSGGAATMPEYAFSDVYLSTEKRLVPGGDITFEIAAGMQYDIAGPYNCEHAAMMGTVAPDGDLSGDCKVNLQDLAILSSNWLSDWFDRIDGDAPYN